METINVQSTDETPAVILDKNTGIFEFRGKSLPEDVTQFYNPILDWFEEYGTQPNPETRVSFKLDYFNTASSKLILDILMKLEEIQNDGSTKVTVEWHFDEADEDMQEAGEEYADIVDIPFEMMAY